MSKFGWTPAHAADGMMNWQYIGDYDTLSSDFLLTRKGFFAASRYSLTVIRTSSDPDWNEMNKSNRMGCETLSRPAV